LLKRQEGEATKQRDAVSNDAAGTPEAYKIDAIGEQTDTRSDKKENAKKKVAAKKAAENKAAVKKKAADGSGKGWSQGYSKPPEMRG